LRLLNNLAIVIEIALIENLTRILKWLGNGKIQRLGETASESSVQKYLC
jgi:hypothetical protein